MRSVKFNSLGMSLIPLLLPACLAAEAARGTVSLTAFGRAGEGGDDTAVFQKALDQASRKGRVLTIPPARAAYRIGPVSVPSGSRIVLERGVVIQARPGFKMYERMLNIADVSHVEIAGQGAVLRMNKDEYRDGEWRHCLYIAGASDVRISGLSCNDSGGDGLYIGRGDHGPSRNVTVEDCTFDNNRRQGFSLTSGSGIRIARCRFTGTRGTAPESGIDLEPNSAGDFLDNIVIEDCFTGGNNGDGLMVSIGKLTSASPPVSVTVRNHRSAANQRSGYFMTYESPTTGPGVKGSIVVDRSSSENEGEYGAVASFYSSNGPLLTFRDLTVVNPNLHRKTWDNAAVAVKRGGGGIGTLGNVHFIRPKISDPKGNLECYFTFRDYSGIGFANVEFQDPELRSATPRVKPGLFEGRTVQTVSR